MLSDIKDRLSDQINDSKLDIVIGLDPDVKKINVPCLVIYRINERPEKTVQTTTGVRQVLAMNFAVAIAANNVGHHANAFEKLEEYRAQVMAALKGWEHPKAGGKPTLFGNGVGANIKNATAGYVMTFKTYETV